MPHHHFADRLMARARSLSAPVCVGLDPLLERLPAEIRKRRGIPDVGDPNAAPVDHEAAAAALTDFGRGFIESVAALVPAVKINIAFFEPYRDAGVRAYYELVSQAHRAGLLVIGDVKRADIGHSTQQYALAHLGGEGAQDSSIPDAVTVNPYFGIDGVRPFLDQARNTNRGVFVLVQTSNESAADVQGLFLADGTTLGDRMAALVESWAAPTELLGASGYSCIGAVVSPRDLAATRRVRELMPHCLFLVPGFGAQGRTADEVATCFRADGSGAIVNASRSVMFAYDDARYRTTVGADWRKCIESACRDFVTAVRDVLPR